MVEVELLQEEKSYAVDLGGKSYTVIERHNTVNNFTDYEVYELDGDEVDEKLGHELIEAVKRFSAA